MTHSLPPADFYCSQLSAAQDEPMAGTAVSAPIWVLLEYRQPWLAQATNDNSLPTAVQAWLAAQLSAVNGRLQFIRQMPTPNDLACFIAVLDEQQPRLYRFTLETYEELLALSLADVVADDGRFAANLHPDPLFLVCTNGKRDRCCALFGAALYRELAAQVGTAVWQTTHLGGHRFAPTLLTFPDGVSYGRVAPTDVPNLLAAQNQGELLLGHLRGRLIYDAPTQAADYFLRQQIGQPQLTAFQHLQTEPTAEGQWQILFRAANGQTHTIHLQTTDPQPIWASCGGPQPKPIRSFILR
ncbi:MAG: hypothetical protein KBE23_05650 [Chloroflexi bacterium]|nr:hypothetical protein [Chloroflexota bacterium]MBP7042206.1 hypothetical protein [Chloroflexota bacterium]